MNNCLNTEKCFITMHDYDKASNPNMSEVPIKILSFKQCNQPINFFNNSNELNLPYTATSPNLLASFLKIPANAKMNIDLICSSQMFYIIYGSGYLVTNYGNIHFNDGDLISAPYKDKQFIRVSKDTCIYWVNDNPLMQYMGVAPVRDIIPPLIYQKDAMELKLMNINSHENAKNKNRNGILLSNTTTDAIGTKTLTHILWSLLNVVFPNSIQKPHRHNSVALDLCVYAVPHKVYTIMGKELDENGNIKNPIKVYWYTYSAFTTPPGWWHSHVNESNEEAIVLPVQDAGLYTYQRTLDIQFVK